MIRQDKKSFLVGSEQDVEALARKDKAKILVVSDSHGASDILSLILEVYGRDCDAFLFCGDGIQDIAYALEKAMRNRDFAAALPAVIGFVEGNNDCDRYPIHNPEFRKNPEAPHYIDLVVPQELTLKVCGHKILVTHGHAYALYNGLQSLVYRAQEAKAEIVLFGHTHIALSEYSGNSLILNPGSCARPRGGQNAGFATIELTKGDLFFDPTFYCFSGGKIKNFLPL